MVNIILILFLVAILLAFLEIFVTGFGFLGITSLICVGISLVLTYFTENPLLYYCMELITLCVMAVVFWFVIKKYKVLNKVVNSERVNEDIKENNADLLSLNGVTKTVFKPVGFFIVNDKTFEGISKNGYIDKNERIVVVDIKDGKIFVERV
ncbi:MAG: hypothetical protein ACK5LY_02350 [Lachnospirales bacterium]